MAKKIKKYKVGCDSETYAISMVEAPAIESDFVALAEQKEEKQQVFLESNERHMVYGAALIPEKDIYRNNGEQEFYISFTKESIEKMSQDFMKEYRQHEVKTDHEDVANEVCVVESWLVEDSYKDKANALGINVPEGTWMVGMKVNNIETWDRIKAGELKGFSVESMLTLEEFSKQNDNNMNIETNDMNFWNKMKEVLAEVFSKKEEAVEEPTEIEPTNVDLEEQPQAEPTPEPQPTVEEPKVEEPVVEEPKVEEPKPQEEPKVEEQPKDNHLEELVNSLKEEIKALKDMNNGLQEKIKDLGKQPSAEPIKPNAKPSQADSYSAWREQMRKMIG
jgi:hypothetical protein